MRSGFQLELDQIYSGLRHHLISHARDYQWRIEQLEQLRRLLLENDDLISASMWKDLRKSKFECQATEQGIVLGEIELTLKKLKKWMKPQRVSTPLYNQPGRSYIVHDPYGLALIIGAWNYPINLTLAPLVGAISGGNAVMIKPSEISSHTAQTLADLIPKYMDTNLITVVQGGAEETSAILDKTFDTIFFTGSGPVGKIVLAKAAPKLTPVTLELGGKSPAVVMPDADLKVTARRLAWGKFMNAGQTCVAPDYIIAHPEIRDRLIAEMKLAVKEFYGVKPETSPDYCRIINAKNFDRLKDLAEGEEIVFGGEFDREKLFISPTIIAGKPSTPLMEEEIFGPLLPVLEMKEATEILSFINSRPKPLALYLFTKSTKTIELFTRNTSSGSLLVNDVVIHMPVPKLPFGGVGASGMGHYHGRFSFDTFTHAKGVLRKSFWLDLPVRYAPYTSWKSKVLSWLMR